MTARAKLGYEACLQIKERYNNRELQRELAECYGVNQATISRIVNDALDCYQVRSKITEDNLERIFKLQWQFDQTVQNKPPFSEYTQGDKVAALLGHLIHESYETRNALGKVITGDIKWWKQNVVWDDVQEELIDCLHFLVSAMLNAGMTSEDVVKEYEKKNAENHARQEREY
jgi:dUTPase.